MILFLNNKVIKKKYKTWIINNWHKKKLTHNYYIFFLLDNFIAQNILFAANCFNLWFAITTFEFRKHYKECIKLTSKNVNKTFLFLDDQPYPL